MATDAAAAGDDEAGGAVVAAAALLTGIVAKTPPVVWVAVLLGDAAAAELEPEPPDAGAASLAWQFPTGAAYTGSAPGLSTELPGFGNVRSVESCVEQPLPTLATNISGKAL